MALFYTRNKAKKKKETAKQKRDREEATAAGKALKEKWASEEKFSSKNRGKVVPVVKEGPPPLTTPPGRTTTHHLKSKVTPGGEATKVPDKVYTGTKMLGVATMHKSNGVAVFSDDHLVDIANMRRNDYTRDVKKKPNDDAGILPPSDEW